MSCTTIIFLVILGWMVLCWIGKSEQNAAEEKDEQLKKENPELWLRMQELEEAKKQREQQAALEEKRMKQQSVRDAVGAGLWIVRTFMR
jgi:hypothetical protein